jgi:hypothetical protein
MTDTINRQAVIDAIASVLSKGERPFSPVAPLLTAINAIPSQPTQSDALKMAREGLEAAIRAADLAIFVIRKQAIMPNGSWSRGFDDDLKKAEESLAALRESKCR